ncbi:hypothetical protein NKI86_27210 [Mesorhizobium sp. M0320]
MARARRNRFRGRIYVKARRDGEESPKASAARGSCQDAIATLQRISRKWTEIEEVAQETSAVFAELDGAKRALAEMKKLR